MLLGRFHAVAMDDQRVETGAAFHFEYLRNGVRVRGVRSKSVYRLGRKGHDLAVAQGFRCAQYVIAVCRFDSHLSV